MPLRWRGRWRKRWHWVGAFGGQALGFAAVVELGPVGIGFWGVWDRERRMLYEQTRRSAPWRRSEVRIEGPRVAIASPDCSAAIALGAGEPIESICPNDAGGYTWTRKLAGVAASGEARLGGRTLSLAGHGVEDVSAGYHARHTVWKWSAGIGVGLAGESLGWNLVEGINDPPRGSERAIWIDGSPGEPQPVAFEGLDAIRFADGSRLSFRAETERSHTERVPLLARSRYRAPLGSFTGSLGGIELRSGLGVMESHDVLW
jgi:Protein of unknown function (DUF2804)